MLNNRMRKFPAFHLGTQGNEQPRVIQRGVFGVTVAMALLLAGCPEPEQDFGQIGLVEGFAGVVAADEPNAAVIGREVLANNGSAVDAAVAMGFALSVTLPSRAGLGGGGACVVYDAEQNGASAVLFPPLTGASGAVAPATARGLALLHGRFGHTRWELLIAPAENLARFGHAVSRAFVTDLQARAFQIAAEPALAATFMDSAGRLPAVGSRLVQPELSALLGGLRARGTSYFHGGGYPDRLAAAAQDAGLPLTAQEIRQRLPRIEPPIRLEVGDNLLYLPPPPVAGGVIAGQIWQMLTEAEDWADAGLGRALLFAEAEGRALANQSSWRQSDGSSAVALEQLMSEAQAEALLRGAPPPRRSEGSAGNGAGLVVADRFGNAVACGFTMNGLFGSGKMAPEAGIIFAAPAPGRTATSPLALAVVGNENTERAYFAASAGAGEAAPGTLARLLLEVHVAGRSLDQAVAAARLHYAADGTLRYEPNLTPEAMAALRNSGALLVQGVIDPRLTTFHCPRGARQQETAELCRLAVDPRGHGLGEIAY
jgi:gamma-glutamyltranspeptidase/glutathione hydrolase